MVLLRGRRARTQAGEDRGSTSHVADFGRVRYAVTRAPRAVGQANRGCNAVRRSATFGTPALRYRCRPSASKINVVGRDNTDSCFAAAGLASISISRCDTSGQVGAHLVDHATHRSARATPDRAEVHDGRPRLGQAEVRRVLVALRAGFPQYARPSIDHRADRGGGSQRRDYRRHGDHRTCSSGSVHSDGEVLAVPTPASGGRMTRPVCCCRRSASSLATLVSRDCRLTPTRSGIIESSGLPRPWRG